MTAKEIAKAANCSINWVYAMAKEFGRLPTVEEILQRKGKRGRPRKNFEQEEC